MSSTNRGRKRNANDYYRTPLSDVQAFLEASKLDFEDKIVYDPCAGGDNVNPMSYPSVIKNLYGLNAITSDIREDSPAEHHLNYLKDDFVCEPDIIISNPPFIESLEFVQRALENVKEGGACNFLIAIKLLREFKEKRIFTSKYARKDLCAC